MNNLKNISSNKLFIILSLLTIVIFFGQSLSFVWNYAAPYCQADDWRQIKWFVQPFYKGELTTANLWFGPHAGRLYPSLFIQNAELFGLFPHYNARIFIFFQLLVSLILFVYLRNQIKNKAVDTTLGVLGFLNICIVLFSLAYSQIFTWDRVIWGYFYVFNFYLLTIILNRSLFLNNYFKKWGQWTFYALTLFVLLYITYSHFVIFAFSLLAYFGLIMLFQTESRKNALYLFLITLVVIVSANFVLDIVSDNQLHSNGLDKSRIVDLIAKPFNLFLTYSVTLISGVINIKAFTNNFTENTWFIKVVGVVFLLLYLSVIIIGVRRKKYSENLPPVILMLYTLVYILAISLYRYNPSTEGVFCNVVPRYALYYNVGIIGFIWNSLLIANQKKNKKLVLVLFVSFTLLNIVNYGIGWKQSKMKGEYLLTKYPIISENLRKKANNWDTKVPVWVLPPRLNHLAKEGLAFLKENELNLFSPEYPYRKNLHSKKK